MNDLAEKALHGLDVARREIVARPVPVLAASGFAAAAVIMVTGARIGAAPAAVPIDRWFGLLPSAGYRITGVAMGVALLAGIAALIGCWLLSLRVSLVRGLRERQLAVIAAAWATPFVVGPPVLSTDIFGYVAHGLLARRGLSPYHHSPLALGSRRVVDAIDPAFRGARSIGGPLSALGEHVAVSVSAGKVIPAMFVLRIGAVIGVIIIGRLAADLAGPRRTFALGLTILNPAVLILVVSAGNIAGVLGAAVLGALVAASQHRWVVAVLLACVASGLEAVGLLLVAAVIAAHVLGVAAGSAWRAGVRDTVIAVATLTVIVFTVPFGLGWIGNLGAAGREHAAFAPANVISDLMGLIVTSASYDDLAAGGRIAAGVAGATVISYLFATFRIRPLERTVGFALLAAAILAPVVYPSFLLWGLLCLAPTAVGARRDWVIALSCVACVLMPVGLGTRGGQYATIAALGLIAAILVPRLLTDAVSSAGISDSSHH